jgi:hypothetical protein
MPNEHDHSPPDDPGTHRGVGYEPREPSWSDVIGGIWNRLTHPIPPNMTDLTRDPNGEHH